MKVMIAIHDYEQSNFTYGSLDGVWNHRNTIDRLLLFCEVEDDDYQNEYLVEEIECYQILTENICKNSTKMLKEMRKMIGDRDVRLTLHSYKMRIKDSQLQELRDRVEKLEEENEQIIAKMDSLDEENKELQEKLLFFHGICKEQKLKLPDSANLLLTNLNNQTGEQLDGGCEDVESLESQFEKLQSMLKEKNHLIEISRYEIDELIQRIQELEELEFKLVEKEHQIKILQSDVLYKHHNFQNSLLSMVNEYHKELSKELDRSQVEAGQLRENRERLEDQIEKVNIT